MNRVVLAICSCVFVGIVAACGSPSSKVERGSTAHAAASADLQQRRKKVIDDAIERGIFRKVKAGNPVTVIVGPAFPGLDFEDKQNFVGTVAGYHFKVADGDKLDAGETVVLEDAKTGKTIGRLTRDGLTLD